MGIKTFHVCDFCGKSEREVIAIVAGDGIDICDECVAASVQLILSKDGAKLPAGWPNHQAASAGSIGGES